MGINITGYNINITSNSILVHQSMVTNTETTEYYYNVSQFGVYSISVIAVISDLEGEIDTLMTIVEMTRPSTSSSTTISSTSTSRMEPSPTNPSTNTPSGEYNWWYWCL